VAVEEMGEVGEEVEEGDEVEEGVGEEVVEGVEEVLGGVGGEGEGVVRKVGVVEGSEIV